MIRVGDVVTGVYHTLASGRLDVVGRVAAIHDYRVMVTLDERGEKPASTVPCDLRTVRLVQSCYQPQVRIGNRLLSPADALHAYAIGTNPERWAASLAPAIARAQVEAEALRSAAETAVVA